MLLSLAWKNVWRNRRRSLIIVTAITVGLWGALLAGAIMIGWGESTVNTAIDRDLAHIQIHQADYTRDKDVNRFIPGGPAILDEIRRLPGIRAVSGRTLVEGMAASPKTAFGVLVTGIDTASAIAVTDIHDLIVDGTYFGSITRNPVVIGQKLADRLNIRVRSKVVISFQAMDSSLVSAAFRVAGVFKSESAQFDETHVFVLQSDLLRLLNSRPMVHEIAVRAESAVKAEKVLAVLKTDYPRLSVQTWKEIAPEVAVTAAAMENFSYLFVGIILVALIFGITNTMLMAVMERVRELGILIGVGMKKRRVFFMIVLETILLSLTGGFGGMITGGLTIMLLSRTGVDFSAFSSSMESFGVSTILHPVLPAGMYLILTVMIVVAATAAAAMPAWKAVRLQPSQAIRGN